MKTYIAKYFLLFCLIFVSVNGNTQDIKLSRQERKEVRKIQMTENFYILDSLLNSRQFVLEAFYLKNQYGDMVSVSSMINFIRVNGSKGVLQTGSNFRIGSNGVGGATAEGTIGLWEIKRNVKTLTYTLRFNLLTNIGNYDVLLTVTSENRASATISGSTSGKLTWDGHLRTLDDSRVFKGQNSI
jgi:hypothetical protein